jgi:hypothetical protein
MIMLIRREEAEEEEETRKQRYTWTKNTGMNMCQNQQKQVKEAR